MALNDSNVGMEEVNVDIAKLFQEMTKTLSTSIAASLTSFSNNVAENIQKLGEKMEGKGTDNPDNSGQSSTSEVPDNTENSVQGSGPTDPDDWRQLIQGHRKKITNVLQNEDMVSTAASGNLDSLLGKMLPSQGKESTPKSKKPLGDADQELWSEVLEEYQVGEEKGPEIMAPLMSTAKVMWTKELDPDKLKQKLASAKIPENCGFMEVKQCNKFIWGQAKCRSEDIKLQSIQQALTKSQVLVLKSAEMLSNAAKAGDNPDYKALLMLMRDSIGLAGHANKNLNQFRRDMFRASIPAPMQSITKDVPEEDKLLFGDNLEKRAQELQTSSKALSALKMPQNPQKAAKSSSAYPSTSSYRPKYHHHHQQKPYSRDRQTKKYVSKNEKPFSKAQRRGNRPSKD